MNRSWTTLTIAIPAALTACLAGPETETSSAGLTFSDTAQSPYAEEIEMLRGHGITSGCTATRFCPDDNVTRAQAAIFLVRAMNVRAGRAPDDFTAPAEAMFADVTPDHYGFRHVQRLVELGITRGTGNDALGRPLFSPESPVTQGQMAVFVTRALTGQRAGSETFDSPATPMFPGDVPAEHMFFRHVQRQADERIWCGCEPGSRFCVDAPVTRAETAAIVERGFFTASRCMAESPAPSGDARLDALHDATSFDEAVNAALAVGLEVMGGTEPSDAGRNVVIVDPAQPDIVLASIGDDAQIPTSGGPNLRAQGAAWADCQVTGTDAHVAPYPDGKVRAINGRYTIRYDVCRPFGGYNCGPLRTATEAATREADSAGGARTAILFGSRVIVTTGAMAARTLADASLVTDWLGRKTCTVRVNTASATMTGWLASGSAADRANIQSVMTHELGHCLGLDHSAPGAGLVMTGIFSGATKLSAGEKDTLRRLATGQTLSVTGCQTQCVTNSTWDFATSTCTCNPGFIRRPGVTACTTPLTLGCGSTSCDDSQQCCDGPRADFCAPMDTECCGPEACAGGVETCCRGRQQGQGDQCIPVGAECCPGVRDSTCNENSYCCSVGGGAATCCAMDLFCCSRAGQPFCSNEPDCWEGE